MAIGNLFNEVWYLANNPDVKEAVEAGLTDAWTHFETYGKAEGRAPGPLFNPQEYLAANPDVRAAVEDGLITAYDHFLNYGSSEGRSPLNLFDPDFYLSQNPDVAAAVEAGLITATEHFLLYGQNEPRQINPFINLQAYVAANPDLQDAVEAGNFSPLTHLLTYGAGEGRDLGNGINLGIFADDPKFQDAIESGDFQAALDRVAEVAPFLPGFEPPANWEPAADTPIPTDFTPPEGTKLVVPPSVVVPDDVELPDHFEPVVPGDDGDADGDDEPEPGSTFPLTTGTDNLAGGAGNDVFNADDTDGATLQTGDSLKGGAGSDVLNISTGGLANNAVPLIQSIETIHNSDVGSLEYAAGAHTSTKTLDLAYASGLQKIHTDFGGNALGNTMHYKNAALNTVFSVAKAGAPKDASYLIISPQDASASDTTAKIALDASNTNGSQLMLVFNADDADIPSGVEKVEIDAAAGSDANVLFISSDTSIDTLTIKGDGNVRIGDVNASSGSPTSLQLFDASASTGDINWVSAGMAADATVLLGAGDDTVTVAAAAGMNSITEINGGDGHDELYIAAGAVSGYITPTIQNVEVIHNSTLNIKDSGISQTAFFLNNATDVQQIVTHFGTGLKTANQFYYYLSVDTTISVDGSNWNEATLSLRFSDVQATDTINLTMKDVEGYQVFYFGPENEWWDPGANVTVDMENNSGSLTLNNNINKITLTGDGDLTYITFGNQFNEFDASGVVGNIKIQKGGDPSQVALTTDAVITTNTGNDTLNFGASTGNLTINAGAGNDIIVSGSGQNDLTGGAGADTFKLAVKGTAADNLDVIQDFNTGGEQDTLQFGNAKMSAVNLHIIAEEAQNYEALLAAANAVFANDNTTSFVAGTIDANTYVFYGAANGIVAEAAVQIIGTPDLILA